MAAANDDSFDTELFIAEIHNLVCIWNYTSAAYSNAIEKAKAWEYLCCKFCDNFEAKDKKEKSEFAIKLQRKWRSLRDSYNRELKKRNAHKSIPGASKHRQYLYFNNLSFLKPIAEKRALESSVNNSQQNIDGQSMAQDSTFGSRKVPRRKLPKGGGNCVKIENSGNQESDLIKSLSTRLSDRLSKQDHTDSDLHFLLSLYESFKTIDGPLKLQAQIEILNVIQKYNRPHPPDYSHSYNGVAYASRQNPMSSHTQYPIQVNPTEFQVPRSSNQPVFSSQSASTQSTVDETMLSNIFKKEFL